MSLIEGIGDEVTVFFSLLVLLVIGLLAWFSTHTSDIPFFSVIVVELSQRALNRNTNTVQNEPTQEENDLNRQSISAAVPAENVVTNNRSITEIVSSALDNVNEALSLDGNILNENDSDDSSNDEEDDEEESDDENFEDMPSLVTESVQHETQALQASSSAPAPVSEPVLGSESSSEIVDSTTEPEIVSTDELRKRRVAFFNNDSKGSESLSSTAAADKTETVNVNQSVTVEPENVSTDELRKRRVAEPETVNRGATSAPTVSPADQSAPQTSNSESKNQIRVRLKYLNDTQRLVLARPLDTIGVFKRTHFQEELSQQKLVRLIYNGQDLRNETSTLQSCNVTDNSVLHCLVTQNSRPPQHINFDPDDNLNIGNFMIPIFGLLLGALWYLRFNYKQYFNATSTLSLAGISFLFVFAAFTALRPRNGQEDNRHLD